MILCTSSPWCGTDKLSSHRTSFARKGCTCVRTHFYHKHTICLGYCCRRARCILLRGLYVLYIDIPGKKHFAEQPAQSECVQRAVNLSGQHGFSGWQKNIQEREYVTPQEMREMHYCARILVRAAYIHAALGEINIFVCALYVAECVFSNRGLLEIFFVPGLMDMILAYRLGDAFRVVFFFVELLAIWRNVRFYRAVAKMRGDGLM